MTLSSRELQSQLHSPQYQRYIFHIQFIGESTRLSINTLLALSNHSLKRFYQIFDDQLPLACTSLLQLINNHGWLFLLQVEHDVSLRPLSRTGHQQKMRYLLALRISRDLPLLDYMPTSMPTDLKRCNNKFFLRNDLTLPKMS